MTIYYDPTPNKIKKFRYFARVTNLVNQNFCRKRTPAAV